MMVDWSPVLNVVGILIESLAVLFGLRRLFKQEYESRTSQQIRKDEKLSDGITLVLVFTGMLLQIIAVLIDAVG